jgi:hypothetical protein
LGSPATNVLVQGKGKARKMIGIVGALQQHEIPGPNETSQPLGRVPR